MQCTETEEKTRPPTILRDVLTEAFLSSAAGNDPSSLTIPPRWPVIRTLGRYIGRLDVGFVNKFCSDMIVM